MEKGIIIDGNITNYCNIKYYISTHNVIYHNNKFTCYIHMNKIIHLKT